MKPRITFAAGLWHVTEPSGEVVWHFATLPEAADKATALAEMRAGKYSTVKPKRAHRDSFIDGMDGAPK